MGSETGSGVLGAMYSRRSPASITTTCERSTASLTCAVRLASSVGRATAVPATSPSLVASAIAAPGPIAVEVIPAAVSSSPNRPSSVA